MKLSFKNRCPHCETGPIFSGLGMSERCAHCQYVFYREPGYFLGSMIISYFASSGLGILLLLILFFGYQIEITAAAAWAVASVALVMPIFSRISRIAWIRIDHQADPSA